MPSMGDEIMHITVKLCEPDAIVLFDWLMTVDLNNVPISHRSEKQALMDLLTRLEETESAHAADEQIQAHTGVGCTGHGLVERMNDVEVLDTVYGA